MDGVRARGYHGLGLPRLCADMSGVSMLTQGFAADAGGMTAVGGSFAHHTNYLLVLF